MKLSNFELDIMQVLWDSGAASAPIIHQNILQQKNITYSTVKKVIDRLEEKGALKRSWQEGRTVFYEATVSRKSICKIILPVFLRRLFGNNHIGLIAQIIRQESLSIEKLNYLEEIIKKKKEKNKDL